MSRGSNTRDDVERALSGFILDPPASEFQRGYLASLLTLHREGLDDSSSGLTPRDLAELEAMAQQGAAAPIPMILHCPRCGLQHVDAPSEGWDNPPHRSHLCHGCGCIWRPADVPTCGVATIATKGGADSWPASEWPDEDGTLARRRSWIADEQAALEAYVANYVLTTEGNDYVPTEDERQLIDDALQGWVVEQDDLLTKRLGFRLFMENVR